VSTSLRVGWPLERLQKRRVWLDRKGSPLTEQGKITERFHRINYGHMEVRVTVTDPKAYTHPFTVTLNEYLERAGELMDFVSLENDSSGPQFLERCSLEVGSWMLEVPISNNH